MNNGLEDIVIKEDKDVSTLKIFSTIDPILLISDTTRPGSIQSLYLSQDRLKNSTRYESHTNEGVS